MKHNKQFLIPVVAAILLAVVKAPVSADLIAGVSLNAQSVVNSFNAGGGIPFVYSAVHANGNWHTFSGAYPTSAYAPGKGGSGYLVTLSVEDSVSAMTPGVAKLNYANNTTTTRTENKSLSVGAAFLYAMYASGQKNPINLQNYANWIRGLMYTPGTQLNIDAGAWTTQAALMYLLEINSNINYWTSLYNPDAYYTEIGNYSVFVVNAESMSGSSALQNYLYLANATNPYDYVPPVDSGAPGETGEPDVVPEPATLLLWTLGGIGMAGASWARKRRMKKLTPA